MNFLVKLPGLDTKLELQSDRSCLPCFRELSSLWEAYEIFQKKQDEILKRIGDTKSLYPETGRKKPENSKTLVITKEIIPNEIVLCPKENHDSVQNRISLQSIISMDAEITITQEENGGAAIDFEVVEGTSDLQRPNGFFGCRFCKREFSESKFSIKHMLEMHGKLLHKCDVCGLEFRLKTEVDQHRATHLKEAPLPYLCGSCPRGFGSFEEFQDHSRTHQLNKKFGCAQCGKRFKDEGKLHKHMMNHNTNPYSCQRCKKTFRSKTSCAKHRKLHGESKNYNCELCLKHFLSAEGLHLHLKKHRNPNKLVL